MPVSMAKATPPRASSDTTRSGVRAARYSARLQCSGDTRAGLSQMRPTKPHALERRAEEVVVARQHRPIAVADAQQTDPRQPHTQGSGHADGGAIAARPQSCGEYDEDHGHVLLAAEGGGHRPQSQMIASSA